MLADFAPMFPPRETPGDPGTALAALSHVAPLGPAARERLKRLASLQAERPAQAFTDAQRTKTADIDAALAVIAAEPQAVRTALDDHLVALSTAFRQLATAPPPVVPSAPDTGSPPEPAIAGVTPAFFDAYRPDRWLARLTADLDDLAGRPEAVDARFARAVRYLEHYPTDAGIDALADPLADYLRARLAVSLIACAPSHMAPFAETYTADGHSRNAIVHAHFGSDSLPLTDDLKALDRPPGLLSSALDEPLRTLAEPYLQAQRAGRIDPYLAQLRSTRLAELTALAQRLAPALDAGEARRRTEALAAGIDSLLEDLLLYHREADDLRVEERWSRLGEQAEGLDRDLRAGRLRAVIAPEQATALLTHVAVFRETAVATVLANDSRLAQLRAYRDAASTIAAALRPTVAAAMQVAIDDLPALQRDLHLTLLASFHTQTWYRRKLQAELYLKERQLAGVPESERLTPPHGLRCHR